MKLLEFRAYDEFSEQTRTVHLDPLAVASVVETETRRAYGGYFPVCRVTMRGGETFVLHDGNRRVARDINDARAGD